MQQSLESVTEQIKADAEYAEEITQKAEESTVRVKTLEEAILEMGKDKKETNAEQTKEGESNSH